MRSISHWYVDYGNCTATEFFVDSMSKGGFTIMVAINENGMEAFVFPPSVADKPAANLNLAWADAGVLPDFTQNNPFSWEISDCTQYGYLTAFGVQLSIKQDDEGLVLDAGPADGSNILASTWVLYQEISDSANALVI